MGLLELHLEAISVADLIASSTSLFREQTVRRHLSIDVEVPDGIGSIQADVRKIRQVLFNLLANAVNFSPPGSRITVRTREVATRSRSRWSIPGQVSRSTSRTVSSTSSPRPIRPAGVRQEPDWDYPWLGGSSSATAVGCGSRATADRARRSSPEFLAAPNRQQLATTDVTPSTPRSILGEPDTPERRHETGRSHVRRRVLGLSPPC